MSRLKVLISALLVFGFLMVDTPASGAKGANSLTATLKSPYYSTDRSATRKFAVSWSATAAVSYEVQYKDSAAGIWSAWLPSATATVTTFVGVRGHTYYFRARAKDINGRIGRWSNTSSTIVPFNQSTATYTGLWGTTPLRRVFYFRTAKFASSRRARSIFQFKNAKELALIITKRPKGGLADVYVNGVKAATVDFYSPTVVYRAPVLIKSFPLNTSGRLKVAVRHRKNTVSAGYRVELDGFAARN